MSGAATKRIKILSDNEVHALYSLPEFNHEDRKLYFSLSYPEQEVLETFHYNQSKLHFILQLGYFKAKKMFFTFGLQDVKQDIRYIREKYFPDLDELQITEITKPTRLTHQDRILKLYGYQKFTEPIKNDLAERSKQLVTICARPRDSRR